MATQFRRVTVTTTGANGSAAGTATTLRPIEGLLLAIHIDYAAGDAATADVTIATTGTSYPAQTLLVRSDSKTDGWFYPRVAACDAAAAALTAYEVIPIADYVSVTVAQGNAGTVVATLMYEG